MKWFLIAIGMIAAAVVGAGAIVGFLPSAGFMFMFLVALSWLGGWLVLHFMRNVDRKSEQRIKDDVKKFGYSWKRANQLLMQMPGQTRLEWAQGWSSRVHTRTMSDGQKRYKFRAFYGYTSDKHQIAITIYCVDDDDIWDFIADPTKSQIEDPFYNFKPFSIDAQYYPNPQDPRYKRRKGGILNLRIGQEDEDDGGGIEPEPDAIAAARNTLTRYTNGGNGRSEDRPTQDNRR